jgi:hypothetical protein
MASCAHYKALELSLLTKEGTAKKIGISLAARTGDGNVSIHSAS